MMWYYYNKPLSVNTISTKQEGKPVDPAYVLYLRGSPPKPEEYTEKQLLSLKEDGWEYK